MNNKDKHSKKRRCFFYCMIFIIILIIPSIFFGIIPTEYKTTIAMSVLSIIVLPSILIIIFKKEKITIGAIVTIISLFVSSCIALAKPELSIKTLLHSEDTTEPDDNIYDKDFIQTSDESDAIESIVEDIDDSVFEKFYQLSFVKDGNIKGTDAVPEERKLETIIDMIICNIEQNGLNRTQYTDTELNSGKYSEFTREANQLEEAYRKEKESQDLQENISRIQAILQKRIEAYADKKTSDLAKLLGNTYAELSSNQVVNDNIVSNCDAIRYYVESCQLSTPTEKCDVYYEIGIRFNSISEIAKAVYKRENSIEYKQLYIDSLYMAVGYYKLYRDSFIEDFKNNYYLARCYKLLGEALTDNVNKILYFEKAVNILHTLEQYNDLSPKSRSSVCNLLYNTLSAYKEIPDDYWNKYTSTSIEEELCDKEREKTLYEE